MDEQVVKCLAGAEVWKDSDFLNIVPHAKRIPLERRLETRRFVANVRQLFNTG